MIRHDPDGNGGTVRTITLTTHVAIVGGLCTIFVAIIAVLSTWTIAASTIPEKVALTVERRIAERLELEKAAGDKIHEALLDRIRRLESNADQRQ